MSAILLPYTHSCFVCGANNPHGLQLRFRAEANGEIRADFLPRPHHAGYLGILHGGIIASALDEAMFWAVGFPTKQFHVSVELNVRYLKKVEINQPYLLVARLMGKRKHIHLTAGELRDAAGEEAATSTGKYFPMDAEGMALSLSDYCPDPATLSPADFLPHR